MAEWNVIMFLSSPFLRDLDALITAGLYIDDLSMHDFSRCLSYQNLQTLAHQIDSRNEFTNLYFGRKFLWQFFCLQILDKLQSKNNRYKCI
jgi:hypothetical protein